MQEQNSIMSSSHSFTINFEKYVSLVALVLCLLKCYLFLYKVECTNTCCTFPLEKAHMLDLAVVCFTGAKQIISTFSRSCLLTNLAKWGFGIVSSFFLFWHFAKLGCRTTEAAILSRFWKDKTKPADNCAKNLLLDVLLCWGDGAHYMLYIVAIQVCGK